LSPTIEISRSDDIDKFLRCKQEAQLEQLEMS